uniref:UMOD/GP2/OIT3-like D8C domain-containing protein n=1 Tax=Astyanax mexicanus TaxID=7994 RepID=A0A8B9J7M9_ASTMX
LKCMLHAAEFLLGCLMSTSGGIINVSTATSPSNATFDPCDNYTVLNDVWRTMYSYYGYGYYTYGYSSFYSSHDDTTTEWDGWYRLYLQGENAQIPEWCVYYMTSGGYIPLLLGGSHPLIKDGIVSREINGPVNYGYYSDQCNYYRSNPIQVKACPGHYYVYKLVRPDVSIPAPIYTAVILNTPSYDPCSNYVSLDQPWRANTGSGMGICDRNFNWNGWYRLFYYGMNIRMSESCVDVNRCGTYYTLWLSGPHPEIEDGVVTRQVCGNSGNDCCNFKSNPIRVKACPGNYYVYELLSPMTCNMAYCTDVNTTTQTPAPTTVATSSPYEYNFDPCYNHTVLNEDWRNIHQPYWNDNPGHDDTNVEWEGWYRFYLQGRSAQISEGCVSYSRCGGYTPLVLGGSHPREQDGIVTRSVLAFSDTNCNSSSQSKPIEVKACPGDYYVYKLTKPDVSLPMPTYCAVAYDYPSTDPCDNYNVLDQSWRATDNADRNYNYYYWWWWYTWCDSYTFWNGWYRLLYHGNTTRMPESCVNQGMCGTDIPLWLNGSHPRLEDGVVSRQLLTFGYYTALSPPIDPCYNYNELDELWRATNQTNNRWCDSSFGLDGWYRLLYDGNNIRMPESCVNQGMCGTDIPLWLTGSHPRLEDGVVSRQVCGSWYGDCCYFKSFPIQVKACPGNYYVYEFVSPVTCSSAYCAGKYHFYYYYT